MTVDSLIEEAAAQTAEEYVETYGELERYVVEEQTYMTPLYQKITGRGFSNVLDANTITNNQRWEDFSYADSSQNSTRPLILSQTAGSGIRFVPTIRLPAMRWIICTSIC